MSVIDDVKSRIDIVELISETVKLRKSGRTYTGLCPFHAHKNNTPSFAIWPESGNWKCFGQCNEGGDIFKFIMKRDGVEFAEALRVLAQRAGVELKPRTPAEQEQDDNLDHLRHILETAVTYYHHLLKNAPAAQVARAHLAQRGLTDKAIELFQLGYALDSWDTGLKYFSDKGYSQKDLLDAGLIVEKEESKVFDRFRDRLMIPVRDERGRMTGFQARALKPDAQPKFMNSPQTALFDKGRTLFGLPLARKAIREAEAAVIVEGNLDVIAAHQAGFANVVSSQGTALTEHQLRLLKKYAKRLILALDADEAGAAATLRGLSVAHEALDREAEVLFDPRGLVKVEGRLGADIRVMTLPAGLDPDDVLNRNPEEWRGLVEAAEPVVAYVIRALTTGRDLDDPKVKTEIAEAVLPLIEDVAQPIERDTYRQKLARVLHVDERSLTVKRPAPKRDHRAPAQRGEPAPKVELSPDPVAIKASREASKLETYCLSAILRRPELVYKADRELQTLGLTKLSPEDFASTEHQLIFHALALALEQFDKEVADHVRDHLDPELRPGLEALLNADYLDPASLLGTARRLAGIKVRELDEKKAIEDLLTSVMRLRQRVEDLRKHELHFLAQEAREKGEREVEVFYQEEYKKHALAFEQIGSALEHRSKRFRIPAQGIGAKFT
jgi:DNA primase